MRKSSGVSTSAVFNPTPFGIDEGRCSRELIGGTLGGAAGAALGSTVGDGNVLAVETTARVLALEDIEMFLPNHAWNAGTPYPQGSIFERALRIADGHPNPFVDGAAWQEWIGRVHQRNVDNLAEDRAEAGQQ